MKMAIISSILALGMGIFVLFIRIKSSHRPVSQRKIILPPIFMSTGALMFFLPTFRVTLSEVLEAIVVGMIFSILLIKTSRFEIRDQNIYLKRSKAFAYILIGLLIIRMIGKVVLSSSIDYGQLSGMFFLLAFGMIVPWRIAMFIQYKRLKNEMNTTSISTKTI